jgi:hypothetical protein
MKVLWNEVPGRDEKWAKDTKSGMADPSLWKREFECVEGKTLITILNNVNEQQQITIEELYSLL